MTAVLADSTRRFDAVLGRSRSLASFDDLASANPSPLARERAKELVEEVRAGEPDSALEMLRRTRNFGAPLIVELADELVEASFSPSAWKSLLSDALWPTAVTSLEPRIDSTQLVGADERGHFWPQGRELVTVSAAPDDAVVACGQRVQNMVAYLHRHTSSSRPRLRACAACSCAVLAAFEKDPAPVAHPLGAEETRFHSDLMRRLRRLLVDNLHDSNPLGRVWLDADEPAHAAFAHAAAYKASGDPVLLRRVFAFDGADRWPELARKLSRPGLPAHELLGARDWRHLFERAAAAPEDPFRPGETLSMTAHDWATLVLARLRWRWWTTRTGGERLELDHERFSPDARGPLRVGSTLLFSTTRFEPEPSSELGPDDIPF